MCKRDSRYMPMRNQKVCPMCILTHSDFSERVGRIARIAFWSRGVMVRLCRAMRALLWHETQQRLWWFRTEYAFDIPSVYHLLIDQGWAWYHMLTQESAAHVGTFSLRLAFYMERNAALHIELSWLISWPLYIYIWPLNGSNFSESQGLWVAGPLSWWGELQGTPRCSVRTVDIRRLCMTP